MNHDVPSTEVCRRLATVWRYEGAQWAYNAEGVLLTYTGIETWTPAPTIGEMLAEVARRGWGFRLDRPHSDDRLFANVEYAYARYGRAPLSEQNPAEALALALAGAMEATR